MRIAWVTDSTASLGAKYYTSTPTKRRKHKYTRTRSHLKSRHGVPLVRGSIILDYAHRLTHIFSILVAVVVVLYSSSSAIDSCLPLSTTEDARPNSSSGDSGSTFD